MRTEEVKKDPFSFPTAERLENSLIYSALGVEASLHALNERVYLPRRAFLHSPFDEHTVGNTLLVYYRNAFDW